MSIAKNISSSKSPSKRNASLYPIQVNKAALESYLEAGGQYWVIICGAEETRRVFLGIVAEMKSLLPMFAKLDAESGMYQFYISPGQQQFACMRGGQPKYFGRVTACKGTEYQQYRCRWNVCLPHFAPNGYSNSNLNTIGKPADKYPEAGWLAIEQPRLEMAVELGLPWIVDTAIKGHRRVYMAESGELRAALNAVMPLIDKVKGGRLSLYLRFETGELYASATGKPEYFIIGMKEYEGDNFNHLLSREL